MGVMIDGRWTSDEEASKLQTDNGRFQREPSSIRNWITADGSAGPSGDAGFAAEPGRYHLFVAWNCPWAHRTILVRQLKNLRDLVDLSVTTPKRSDQGWVFDNNVPEYRDNCFGKKTLWEVYAQAYPGYTGRVTVPLLYDRKSGQAVSNESSEIVRMFNSAFDAVGANDLDLYPEALRDEIDSLNELIYETLNNGVYRAGFAKTQEAYEEGCRQVFVTLDRLDELLATRRFLCGDKPTEADWRLFPTLVRFDVAYHYAFKCNLRRLQDYSNLWPYTRDLYQTPGIADTVFPDLYKAGYHSLSELRNPLGIVPLGPIVDFRQAHNRADMSG